MGMEKNAAHKTTTAKYLELCGIEFSTVGTSATIRARGIINELIGLKFCVKCQLVQSAFLEGWIGVLFGNVVRDIVSENYQ